MKKNQFRFVHAEFASTTITTTKSFGDYLSTVVVVVADIDVVIVIDALAPVTVVGLTSAKEKNN